MPYPLPGIVQSCRDDLSIELCAAVDDAHVHHHAEQILQAHLRLTDYGDTCSAATLLVVVFAACARLTSLFAAALGLRRVPSGETVRKALLHNLPDAD
jgi:hypothetical protein